MSTVDLMPGESKKVDLMAGPYISRANIGVPRRGSRNGGKSPQLDPWVAIWRLQLWATTKAPEFHSGTPIPLKVGMSKQPPRPLCRYLSEILADHPFVSICWVIVIPGFQQSQSPDWCETCPIYLWPTWEHNLSWTHLQYLKWYAS